MWVHKRDLLWSGVGWMMIPVHHRFFTTGLVKKSTKIQIFVQPDRFFTIEFDDKFIIKKGSIINSKWLILFKK